jgi:hypothetical protein
MSQNASLAPLEGGTILRILRLHIRVPKAALNAEVSGCDAVVEGGRYLDDPVVLDVEVKVAANPAI